MSRKLLFFLPAILAINLSQAQYKLPSAQVLVANQVQKIYVNWISMTSLSPKGKELKDKEGFRPSFKQLIYFINPFGQVDSLHLTDRVGQLYEKDIFTYDEQQRLIKLEKITTKGEVKKSESVCQTQDGYWHYQRWNQGQLEHEIISRLDSLVERTIYHRTNDVIVEAYDFEQEISSRTFINGDEIVAQEKYQWVIEDEKPVKLIYHTSGIEDGKKKIFDKDYLIREDGYLENYPSGHGKDPNWALNFHDRIDRFEGIRHQTWTFFEEETLITKSPIVELINYDGTRYRHYYTFEYE